MGRRVTPCTVDHSGAAAAQKPVHQKKSLPSNLPTFSFCHYLSIHFSCLTLDRRRATSPSHSPLPLPSPFHHLPLPLPPLSQSSRRYGRGTWTWTRTCQDVEMLAICVKIRRCDTTPSPFVPLLRIRRVRLCGKLFDTISTFWDRYLA